MLDKDCPFSDEDLKEMIRSKNGFEEHQDHDWFVGIVVFNLYTNIDAFKAFVKSSKHKLVLNAECRVGIQRSGRRQGKGKDKSKDPNSKLVAVGDMADQQGYLRTPKNMEKISMKAIHGADKISAKELSSQTEEMKVKLIRSSDSVLDGFIKVSCIAHAFPTGTRLQVYCFPGLLIAGRPILLNTMPFRLGYTARHYQHMWAAIMRNFVILTISRKALHSVYDAHRRMKVL